MDCFSVTVLIKKKGNEQFSYSDSRADRNSDPNFEHVNVDHSLKLEKVNKILQELGKPPIKKKTFFESIR